MFKVLRCLTEEELGGIFDLDKDEAGDVINDFIASSEMLRRLLLADHTEDPMVHLTQIVRFVISRRGFGEVAFAGASIAAEHMNPGIRDADLDQKFMIVSAVIASHVFMTEIILGAIEWDTAEVAKIRKDLGIDTPEEKERMVVQDYVAQSAN